MEVQVNVLAVLLAAVASMVVSSVWYSQYAFGKMWSKLVDLDAKQQRKGAGQALVVASVAALITAYVLAQLTYVVNRYFSPSFEYWQTDALQTAFWLWLGISTTTIVAHNAFEQKRVRLTALALGNQFFSFLAMGLVIGLLKP